MTIDVKKKTASDWLKFEAESKFSREQITLSDELLDAIAAAPALDLTGSPIGQVTATGKWQLWDAGATDGTQTIKGLLLTVPLEVDNKRCLAIVRDARVILEPMLDESLIARGSEAAVTAALKALRIFVAKAV